MPQYTLSELADRVNGTVSGDSSISISSLAAITDTQSEPGALSFLVGHSYAKFLEHTSADAVILSKEYMSECPVPSIVVPDPEYAFSQIALLFLPEPMELALGISTKATVAPTATVSPSASIGDFCVIGKDVIIGDNVRIYPGSTIGDRSSIGHDSCVNARVSVCNDITIGERVVIYSGAVIGSEGFGHVKHQGRWVPLPQLGNVVIGNDVCIGSNTTIDRGAIGDTIIGNGVKLDNQIQIGHNVIIGDHTAIAGCVGIAGSTIIGKHCMIGGATCIGGHLSITDNVAFTGMSYVSKSVHKPGIYSSGTGLQSNKDWRRSIARLHKLDGWVNRIKKLEKGNLK